MIDYTNVCSYLCQLYTISPFHKPTHPQLLQNLENKTLLRCQEIFPDDSTYCIYYNHLTALSTETDYKLFKSLKYKQI